MEYNGILGKLPSLLSKAGPIALGVGAVAAGVAITNELNKKALEHASQENDKDKKKQSMEVKGLAEDMGITEEEAGMLKAGSNIYDSDENFRGVKFDNYEAASLFGAKLGIFDSLDVKDFDQTLKKSTKDPDPLTYNKAKIGKSLLYGGIGTDPTILQNVTQAWLIGLYSQGYQGNNEPVLKALSETLGVEITPDEQTMGKILTGDFAMTKSQFNNTVKMMSDADMWLWNDAGKFILPNEGDYQKALEIDGIPADKVEWLNSHRQGLDYVPFDNYPALLHEGEAVLTNGTATEVRNLITEYRESQQQQINFDAVIQAQTESLVNKLEEVKQAIISNGGSNTNGEVTNLLEPIKNRVATSMKNIISTKNMFMA